MGVNIHALSNCTVALKSSMDSAVANSNGDSIIGSEDLLILISNTISKMLLVPVITADIYQICMDMLTTLGQARRSYIALGEEDASTVVTDVFKLYISRYDVPLLKSSAIATPRTALEEHFSLLQTSFSIESSGGWSAFDTTTTTTTTTTSSSDDNSVDNVFDIITIQMLRKLPFSVDSDAHGVRLLLTPEQTTSSFNSDITLSLKNKEKQNYFETEVIEGEELQCEVGEAYSVFARCANDVVFNLTCNGTWRGTIDYECPYMRRLPVCNAYIGDTGIPADDITCEFPVSSYSFDGTSVTCTCSHIFNNNDNNNVSTNSRRNLQVSGNQSSYPINTHVTTFSTSLFTESQDFITTTHYRYLDEPVYDNMMLSTVA